MPTPGTDAAPVPLAKGTIPPPADSRQQTGSQPYPQGERPPLGTPSYSRTSRPGQTLEVAVGGNFARVHFRKAREDRPREWTRGAVQSFSPRSRSRLLQQFAKVDLRGYEEPALFVTLTYHHEWGEISREWKRDIEEYTRRMLRRFPGAWYTWRLEFQRRGAPHFHLLVFGVPSTAATYLKALWISVVEACCEWCRLYLARVDILKSWEQVTRYCAKYCAKVDASEAPMPGRFWGVQHRAARPERVVTAEVTEQEAFRIRRIFKRMIRVANGYHKPGGTRSGVWVRCSNDTAKRALAISTSAHEPTGPPAIPGPDDPDADDGRPPSGIGGYSTPDSAVAARKTFAHSGSTSRLPLSTLEDSQRRWAMSFFA